MNKKEFEAFAKKAIKDIKKSESLDGLTHLYQLTSPSKNNTTTLIKFSKKV